MTDPAPGLTSRRYGPGRRLSAVNAVLDAVDECGPCPRPDGEAGTVRVLRVADQAVCCCLGDLDAVVASGAAAGFAPWPGQCRVVCGGHCCSLVLAATLSAHGPA